MSFYEHSPLNPHYEGYGVSQAISEWLDCYESLIRMRLAVFKNGAVPAFHVQLGEAYMDPDEQFLSRFYGKWFSKFQGEDNSGKPLITGADVEVKSIEGHRPADALAASNQSEEQIRDQTLAALGVPKAIVGLTDDMTYGSVEASKDAFREFSCNAELTYTGQVITHKVIRPTPNCANGILFWEDRLAGDPDYRLREQDQDLKTGVKSVNEVRGERGYEPWPFGGDNPMVNDEEKPWLKREKEPETPPAKIMGEGAGSVGGYLANRVGLLNGKH